MKNFLKTLFKFNNRANNFYNLIKTKFLYRLFFGSIGGGTKIFRPMLIENPSQIYIGKNVLIRDFARLEVINDGLINIGDNVSIEQGLHLISANKVNIGSDTTISFHVMITDVDHSYEEIGVDILKQSDRVQKTIIGDNCFLGAGVRIQGGTVLGKQCIVGANAVVRGQFPDYCVIVGSPAKIVKRYDSVVGIWRKTDVNGDFL